jgi:hypothetical protein
MDTSKSGLAQVKRHLSPMEAEQHIGRWDSMKPEITEDIIDEMFKTGNLLQQKNINALKLMGKYNNLPNELKRMVNLAISHSESRDPEEKKRMRDEMYKIMENIGRPKCKEALIRLIINSQHEGYCPYEPYPPTDVNARDLEMSNFILGLHEEVCALLKTKTYKLVNYYPAMGTPMDFTYSTDGFFIFDKSFFPDKKNRYLGIDITTKPQKKEERKNPSGSIILYINRDRFNKDTFIDYQKKFAKRIVDALKNGEAEEFGDFESNYDINEKTSDVARETKTQVISITKRLSDREIAESKRTESHKAPRRNKNARARFFKQK